MDFISSLRQIYFNVETKKAEEIKSSLDNFNNNYEKFCSNMQSKFDLNKKEIFKKTRDLKQEELKFINDDKNKKQYVNILKLIKNKEYKKAYNLLNNFKKKCENKIFENCIKVRMAYCVAMIHDEFIAEDGTEVGIYPYDLLLEVINSNIYSPVLFDALANWRLIDQKLFHGASTLSEIPNLEYNKKSWEIIKIIKSYLNKNPKDLWARLQIEFLLDLDNISRGGYMGNKEVVIG